MEPIQFNASAMVASAETAFREAGALAVQYSFSILGAIVVLIVGLLVAGALERWSYAGLGRVHGFDETLRRFFSRIIRYGVLVLVGVTVLAQFGVQTASIIAALGAIGLAIGLALQGTLQNIAAGIMLLVLRPFRVGEYVSVGEVSGTVQEIGLFATELKTFDGLYLLAPNSELWSTPITNFSRNASRMAEIVIGIGYDDDIGLAQRTLLEIAGADSRVLAEPRPTAFVTELAPSTVNVKLRYWTRTADYFDTMNEMTKAAKTAFDERGISMPFPQQEVRYVPAEAAAGTPQDPKT